MRRRSVLGLILVFALTAPLVAGPSVQEVGRFVWDGKGEHFGGFSALELGPDGVNFIALSDRGRFVRGQILRGPDGRIRAIEAGEVHELRPPAGTQWPRWKTDSEGLALATDGTVYISFEGTHTVFRFDPLEGPAEALATHPDFAGLISNASFEALAIGPNGALYTLPERSGHLARPFPFFRFQDGNWERFYDLPRRDEFLPVGADFGPDGKFYLLERRHKLIGGFANRVRRFKVTDQGLSQEEVVFESSLGTYSNLEGLAVWSGPGGQINLTMISDDNFNFLQTTEFVEIEIVE
ncbi:MAG: esterase-like activity of phytase family protein [Rhodobacteraceae bacterium]|nr:esterase-like activity of phytase family protein [Paracoccaceae bacterium]